MRPRRTLHTALPFVFVVVLPGCDDHADAAPTALEQKAPPQAQASSPAPAKSDRIERAAPAHAAATNEKIDCAALCQKTASLGCPGHDACLAGCNQSFGMPVCVPELTRFFACTNAKPVTAFECGPEGFAGLKEGHCEPEQQAVVSCIHTALQTHQ